MRLICWLLGHRDGPLGVVKEDGRGAAWVRCRRCGALMGSYSWHDGHPWEDE